MKVIIKIISLLTVTFQLLQCTSNKESDSLIIKHTHSEISAKIIEFDSIEVDASNTSSYGFFFLQDSIIYFSDQMFASLYTYDLSGSFKNRYLGLGNGPSELTNLRKIFQSNNPHIFYALDNANMLYEINNSNWTVSKKGVVDFGWGKLNNGMDPEKPSSYTFNSLNYFNFRLYQVPGTTKMIFPIYSGNNNFCGQSDNTNASYYYKNARIIASLDLKSMKVEEPFGEKPKIYQDFQYIPNMEGMSFDVKYDTIYVSFFPDSLIYAYEYSSRSLLFAFGKKGRNMNQNYYETNSFEKAYARRLEDTNEFGYYITLKYIKETDLLFRGYYKGINSESDGLQIYQNYNLIADIDVAKRFQLIGYAKPYYYGVRYLPDSYNQKFVFFKFGIKI